MMRKLFYYQFYFVLLILFSGFETEYASLVKLDLETAWMRVCQFAPSIAATHTEIFVRQAETRQVNLRPNPVFIIDGQNLGVDPGIEAEVPQRTYTLSQVLEFGGKRKARRDYAASSTKIAYWDDQVARQDLRYALVLAFISVSWAQEKLTLAEQKRMISSKYLEAVMAQVAAGKVSTIEEKKAKLALKTAEIAVREAISASVQEKKKLSSLWGSGCPDFESVSFEIFGYEPLPEKCKALQGIFHIPDYFKAQAEVFSAMLNVRLQNSYAVPDVTVSLGIRTYSDSDQKGWVVAAAMPIPISNHNQGNIQKARFEVTQTQFEKDELMRSLQERSQLIYERLLASFDESEMLRMGVLDEAIDTFQLVKAGYEKGKLPYLDLLEAQSTVFEIQEKYIDMLANYHLNRAELDRLIGRYCNL